MRLAELQVLVRRGESETLEFKETTGLLQEGFRDLSSFLNRSGGTVLFGIQPSGKISGQQVSDRTWRDIADHVVKIVPAVIPEMVTVDVAADRKVIVVRGTPDPGAIPYTSDGRAYERIGTTTRRMSQERYHRLLLQRQAAASRWENQVASGIATAGLDVARIRAAERSASPSSMTAWRSTIRAASHRSYPPRSCSGSIGVSRTTRSSRACSTGRASWRSGGPAGSGSWPPAGQPGSGRRRWRRMPARSASPSTFASAGPRRGFPREARPA